MFHSPITIHTANLIHVKYDNFNMRNILIKIDKRGINGTKGTINGRGVLFLGCLIK